MAAITSIQNAAPAIFSSVDSKTVLKVSQAAFQRMLEMGRIFAEIGKVALTFAVTESISMMYQIHSFWASLILAFAVGFAIEGAATLIHRIIRQL
jgi:hypothetical protein